jgi:hypothetical protein
VGHLITSGTAFTPLPRRDKLSSMAGGPESIQAILRGRRRAGFVGRGGQLAVFRENFGRPPGERAYIFNVYGEGGVGKSTLLEQWRQITRAAGAAEALVDERVFSAPEAMSALLDQLAQPRESKEFRARYASFRKNRERLENDPQAPRELWSQIVRTGVKAADRGPPVGRDAGRGRPRRGRRRDQRHRGQAVRGRHPRQGRRHRASHLSDRPRPP